MIDLAKSTKFLFSMCMIHGVILFDAISEEKNVSELKKNHYQVREAKLVYIGKKLEIKELIKNNKT